MSSLRPTCNKSDAVLAHCLDGDLDSDDLLEHGYGFACGETLQAHLRECAVCRSALQRARRLDAALATAAGTDVARHPGQVGAGWAQLTDRWLAQATAASAEPVATATLPTTLPLQHRGLLAAAAALAVVSTLLGPWALARRSSPSAPVTEVIANATQGMAARPESPTAAPAAAIATTIAAPTRPARIDSMHVASRSMPTPRAKATTATLAELGTQLGAASGSVTERLAALHTLMAACRTPGPEAPRAFHSLVDALAGLGDHDLRTRHLHAAMLQPLLSGDLHRMLTQALVALGATSKRIDTAALAVVAVAARLGEDTTDRALRRLARQHPDVVEAIAAALRCGVRPHGGGRLLLDLWHDAWQRDGAPRDERDAMAWFRQQPENIGTEIAAELQSTRSADRRVQCLLALSASDDVALVAVLRTHMRSGHHNEAHAAAFALAHMPSSILADLANQESLDGEYLLRAALARADAAVARPWVAALDLRPNDRHRLFHGTFADFPEVALWFRDRALLGD